MNGHDVLCERYRVMIQEKSQKATQMKDIRGSDAREIRPQKRSRWHMPKLFIRKGVSQHVLDTADQMIKEYQAVLDYLKDR